MINYLHEIREQDKYNYGNKSAFLGELLHENITIPRGFALSKEIFFDYLRENNISFELHNIVLDSAILKKKILNGEFSEKVKLIIKEKVAEIIPADSEKLIIRSSTKLEDSEESSLAGVFESVIVDNDLFLICKAVKECYVSLVSDFTINYILENNCIQDFWMGITVQHYIAGDYSGVAFSSDVMSMNADYLTFNVCKGTCDQIVEGLSDNTIYTVRKDNLSYDAAVYNVSPMLNSSIIEKISSEILLIEKIFGGYQDIEWTLSNEELYILQARPLTKFRLKEFEFEWESDEDKNKQWVLHFKNALPNLLHEIHESLEEASYEGRKASGEIYEYLLRNINGYSYIWKSCSAFDKNIISRIDRKVFKEYLHHRNPLMDDYLPKIIKRMEAILSVTAEQDIEPLSDEKIIALLDESLNLVQDILHNLDVNSYYRGHIQLFFNAYPKIFENEEIAATSLLYQRTLRSMRHIYIMRMVHKIKKSPSLLKMFQECHFDALLLYKVKNSYMARGIAQDIQNYLDLFGLYPISFDERINLMTPGYIEKPEKIITLLRGLLESEPDALFSNIKKIEKEKRVALKRILHSFSDKKEKQKFMLAYKTAEKAYLGIDNFRYYLEDTIPSCLRLVILLCGKRLSEKNKLARKEDIFFLYLNEIKMLLNDDEYIEQKIISERKKDYKKHTELLPPEKLGLSQNGKEDFEDEHGDETILTGNYSTHQKVTGNLIVGMPNELKEKKILLTSSRIYDVDLLKIINSISGIIFADQDQFTHNAIIAREFGIPSIYHVSNADKILKQDDKVTIDGLHKRVILHRIKESGS